ncbi:MAG: molybdopterin-binding protein, partial [Actinomycetales bacterium]
VTAGKVQLGGMAWAQELGVSKVQLRVADGQWQDAMLAPGISKDTWYQWAAELDIPRGSPKVAVRAFDGNGKVQIEQQTDVAPDGATGYHTITVNAG